MALFLLGALVSTAGLAACESDSPVEPEPSIERRTLVLSIAPSQAILNGGQSLRLNASVKVGFGPAIRPADVTWFSTDEAVATVQQNGLVRAMGDGQARIVALWHGAQGVARVTVTGAAAQKPEAPVPCALAAQANAGIPQGPGCP